MQELRRLDSMNLLLTCQALANSANRPGRVLCDQGFVIGGGDFQRRQVFFGADISERDADVSQESAPLDSFNRRIAKEIAKLSVGEIQIIAQTKCGCRSSRGECGLVRDLSEPIPRTCIEAIVAAENSVADQRAKLERNRAFQFNRQI